MIRINDRIWIGNSADECGADLELLNIGVILNVARDLRNSRGFVCGTEYVQVGLVDGPGNPDEAYCAAVLALSAILRYHDKVLVCCHSMSRSLAVVVMYLSGVSDIPWDYTLTIIGERVDEELPEIHNAHKDAFVRIKWWMFTNLMR